jgi:hypothetical protein
MYYEQEKMKQKVIQALSFECLKGLTMGKENVE